jgi:hypothetical protein
VVGSSPLGEAYVIPLQNTFDNVKEALEAEEVSLPDPVLSLVSLMNHYFKKGYVGDAKSPKDVLKELVLEGEIKLDEMAAKRLAEEKERVAEDGAKVESEAGHEKNKIDTEHGAGTELPGDSPAVHGLQVSGGGCSRFRLS